MNSESTDSKMSEPRDTDPTMQRHEREDHSIRDNSAPVASATIHDRTALYVSIFSMVLSALCLGLFLMQTFLMPQIIKDYKEKGILMRQNPLALEYSRESGDSLDNFLATN